MTSAAEPRMGPGRAAAVTLGTVMGGVVWVDQVFPPWSSKLIPMLVVVAAGILLAIYLTRRPPLVNPYRADGTPTYSYLWTGLALVVLLVAGVALSIGLAAMTAAYSLPRDPAVSPAIRTLPCEGRGCSFSVVFEAGGREVTAPYAAGRAPGAIAKPGAPFAYDPAAPTHVMPQGAFEYGRATAPTVVVVSGLAIALIPVVAEIRRRRRG